MNKVNTCLILFFSSIVACIAVSVIGDYHEYAYALAFISVGYYISLCGGDDQRTLPTQCLDEACKMMENVPGIWYLVATPGHCVVAHKSKQLALGVFGYAVVDNRPDHKRTVSASIAKGSDK